LEDYSGKSVAGDPRLHLKTQSTSQLLDSTVMHSLPTAQPVASMSQEELVRMAREQMDALEQMKHASPLKSSSRDTDHREPRFGSGSGTRPPSGFPEPITTKASSQPIESQPTMHKISFQWKKKK